MTADELIRYLERLPPDTPVVYRDGRGDFFAVCPTFENLFRTFGGFGQFTAQGLLHRNNVTALCMN